ncbi:MAG: ABC transporter ATP-binding protein [Candidatus Latescibacteria bacterium]|nr:ABC transporter ATP-binding protein [Candidatus Latescibacterota bacterium]
MRIFRRVLRYLRPYRGYLVGSVICTIFFTLFSGLMVWMLMPTLETLFEPERLTATAEAPDRALPESPEAAAADRPGGGVILPAATGIESIKTSLKDATRRLIAGPTPQSTLVHLCIALLLIVFLKNLFAYLQGYLMSVAEHGLIKDLRVDLFKHMSGLSLGYYHKSRTGVLMARVTSDVTLVNQSAAAVLVDLIKHPLSVLVFLIMAVVISPWLTVVSLLVLPISGFVINRLGQSLFRRTGYLQAEMGNLTSILSETLGGIRVVKAFDMEAFEAGKFASAARVYFQRALKLARVSKLAAPSSEVLAATVGVGILYLGGIQVLGGSSSLSADEFITFLLVLFSMFSPLREVTKAYVRLQQGLAAADRVFEIIDTPPLITDLPGARPVEEFHERVQYENVFFEYEPGVPVLEGINLGLERGKIVALVGPSGAGKSTLADLLPRFYDPTSGAVLMDGTDLRGFTVGSLRRLIGVVTQETILFNDSAARNIAYGQDEYDIDKVRNAAEAANAHDFIAELPEGYDTMLGDRGVRLSGGQRQRLAIARAIMKNPPILILDEATSSLDTESEMLVQEALERLMKDRTTLVIAHRLSTVQRADRIVVLDGGSIVQQGTHEELMQQADSIYRRLHTLQFKV